MTSLRWVCMAPCNVLSIFCRAVFDGLLPGDIKVAVVEKKERPAMPLSCPVGTDA